MIFDFYDKAVQTPLTRIQIGQHVIVRSSTPAKCFICGAETHWRDSEDMQPICEKICLQQLHSEEAINNYVERLKSNELHT